MRPAILREHQAALDSHTRSLGNWSKAGYFTTALLCLACAVTPVMNVFWPDHLSAWLIGLAAISLCLVLLLVASGLITIQKRSYAFLFLLGSMVAIGLWSAINSGSVYDPTRESLILVTPTLGFGPSSVDQRAALANIKLIAPIALLAWAVSALSTGKREQITALGLLSLMTLLLCLVAFLGKTFSINLVANTRHEASIFGWFATHGHAGSSLLIGLMCTCACLIAFAQHKWLLPIGAAMVAFILFCLVFVNISEASAIISIAVLSAWGWLIGLRLATRGQNFPRPRVYALGTVALASLACASGWAFGLHIHLTQILGNSGFQGRLLMWQSGWPIALDAGFTGYGPGSYKVLLPISDGFLPQLYRHWIVTPYAPGEPVSYWSHAHNDYLQAVIEWGWGGAMVWVGMLVYAAGRLCAVAWRSVKRSEAALASGAAAAIIGVMLHAIVDTPFQSPLILTSVAILTGTAWAWQMPSTTPPHIQHQAVAA
jgi:O-antigen ligase